MLRKSLVLCLLLVIATALSARVRVAALEDPRSSTDVVFAVDNEGYLYSVEPTGWVQINEQPCPTAGSYDIDVYYDYVREDLVVLVVDGGGVVYTASAEEWVAFAEPPADGEGPYLISAFYNDGIDAHILILVDTNGQLYIWYRGEQVFVALFDSLLGTGSYSIAEYVEADGDTYQLHAVDSAGTIYAFLSDGWYPYPVKADGEPPYLIALISISKGIYDFIVSLDGVITLVEEAEETASMQVELLGEPPYDMDFVHVPNSDIYSSYLIDSHGTLYSFDGESWIQVLDRLPE